LPQTQLENLAGPSTWRRETASSGALGRWRVLCPLSDVEVLEGAPVEMPVYRPAPEDLAFDYVYSRLADFL